MYPGQTEDVALFPSQHHRIYLYATPLAWDDALPRPHQADLEDDTAQITCAADVPTGAALGSAATGRRHLRCLPALGSTEGLRPFVGTFTGMAQANHAVRFDVAVP